MLRCPLVII